MLKRMAIENFRGFSTLRAELAPVTVLLGPNSSGKTTVLQAIRLACDLVHQALEDEGSAKVRSVGSETWIDLGTTQVADHARILPVADWEALFVNQLVGPGTHFSIELDFEASDPIQAIRVQVECGNNQRLFYSVSVRTELVSASDQRKRGFAERARGALRDHAPRAVFIPPYYGVVREEEYRSRAVVDALLGSGDQSHVVRNLLVRLEPSQIEELNRFLNQLNLFQARLVNRTSPDERERVRHLRVEFQDDDGPLEISAAGAGVTNLIALYASLALWQQEARARPVIYLLDEPEAHLHARLQADAADRMATLVYERFGAQLVLATHSPDIINRLAQRADTLLLRIDRQQPQPVILRGQTAVVDELSAWVDLLPFSAVNFLASRRILFHEGVDDARILRRCAELRFRDHPVNLDRFRAWTLVPLGGTGQQNLGRLLATLVRSSAVPGTQVDPAFRVITILDRDTHRQPGQVEEVGEGGGPAYKRVWSRHSIESLFLDEERLAAWVRAFVESMGEAAPVDLPAIIRVAGQAADRDPDLIEWAERELMFSLDEAIPRDLAKAERQRRFAEAFEEARRRAAAEGSTWHRGKDRARVVLGAVREKLPVRAKNRFPVELPKLLERVNLSFMGDLRAPVPGEVNEVLDLMVGG